MEYAAKVEENDMVVFTNKVGNPMIAWVTHVWEGTSVKGCAPLINLKDNDDNESTSVPHYSSVRGASGYYWG